MPQPLSRFHPNLGCVIASGNTPHTPQMATAILAVINLWAQIDYNYTALLARAAKADPATVTAMFQAITSGDARRAALIAALKQNLVPEEIALILAVMDSSKASRETRNHFAHHLWGSLNTRPDCVVLVHPTNIAKLSAALTAWAINPQGPRPELDRSQVMVWRQNDFEVETAAARVARDRVVQLLFTFDHPAVDQRRPALLEDQQIARLYEHHLQQNIR